MRLGQEDSIRAWNHVPIRIIDIRHMSMRPGEQERYVFPSSVFVFTNQGRLSSCSTGPEVLQDNHRLCMAAKAPFFKSPVWVNR